jgi:hypothetical protein
LLSDTDSDLLDDGDEVLDYGTDPLDPDSDDDGLLDGTEVSVVGTDPLDFDTDNDLIGDAREVDLLLDPLIPNPTGLVDEVYCDDLIAILGLPEDPYYGVFKNNSLDDFGSWRSGHLVAMSAPGTCRLANLTLDRSLGVTWLGDRSAIWGDTWIWAIAADNSWIQTPDGTFWFIWLADQFELWNWYVFDDLTILVPIDVYSPWRIVNIDRCEVVRAD